MAAQTLELARAIKPQDANVLITLGEIYNEEHEYVYARDAFAEALKAEPDLLPAVTGLGWAHLHLGDNVDAAATFRDNCRRAAPYRSNRWPRLRLFRRLSLASTCWPSSRNTSKVRQDAEEIQVAFVRAAALDKAGRYKEAWDQATPANQKIFLEMKEDVRDLFDRQRVVLGVAPRE